MRRRVRGASETLAVQVADAVARMRDSDVQKPPGVAEAIDWVAALAVLGVEELDVGAIDRTLGLGAQVRRGPGGDPRRRPREAGGPAMTRRGAVPGSRRWGSICRRSPARSAGGCTTPACR